MPAYANGRDADGSRMQARPLTLGDPVSDRIAPPVDSVDWRYLRLSDPTDVTFEVRVASGTSARVTLTDAMGKTITRASTNDGSFSTRRRLDPGLYYVSVSATGPVSYKLTAR